MLDVSVIDLSGQLLMPTSRVKARKLLKYKVSSTFVQFILFKNVQFHFLTHSISL